MTLDEDGARNIHPLRQVATVGSYVNIYCDSDDIPGWTKDGGILPDGVANRGFSLVIFEAGEEDTGEYTCTGRYNNGQSQFTAFSNLYVGCKHYCFHMNRMGPQNGL